MSEEREGAPLTPEQRAEQIRLAKERAAAARAARASGASQAEPAAPEPAIESPAAAAPAAQTEAAAPADRAAAIQAAKERAAAARAAREGGAPPPVAATPAAPAPATPTPEVPVARAAPASPADRAAAIAAAKERAAAARVVREGGAAAPAPVAAAKPSLTPDQRAAALAQAQERAAALKAQRATAAPASTAPAAPAGPVPTWRVAPSGRGGQAPAARPDPRVQSQALTRTDPAARMVLRRREFLRGGFWGGLAVLVAGSLAAFTDFFNPRDVKGFGGIVAVPASDVPPAGGDPIHYLEAAAWVSHLKAGEGVINGIGAPGPAGVLAIYHKCPHLGCTVPWNPGFQFLNHTGWFRCPCHGSTYTKAGYRVFGPAPHSMWTFPVKVLKGGSLSVDTGKISNGNLTQAKTTVPYP